MEVMIKRLMGEFRYPKRRARASQQASTTMEAAALSTTMGYRRGVFAAPAPAPAHRLAAAPPPVTRRRRRRLRALPAELTEILAPKLVPGSPADTGDVSSLIPISAVMLLFYLVSNWVFPAVIMKGMDPDAPADDEEEEEETSMAPPPPGQSDGEVRLKVKRRKRKKTAATSTTKA